MKSTTVLLAIDELSSEREGIPASCCRVFEKRRRTVHHRERLLGVWRAWLMDGRQD